MIIAVRNVSLSERDRKRRNEKSVWLPFAAILSIAAGLQTGEWIISVAILVLYAIWRFAPEWEGPPVIPMALTFQWVQVVSGVFYLALTGRHTIEIDRSDYRPMVLIGLGCGATTPPGHLVSLMVSGRSVCSDIAERRQAGPRTHAPSSARRARRRRREARTWRGGSLD